jgi:ATP-dependent Clp protease adaptor protein ClpS
VAHPLLAGAAAPTTVPVADPDVAVGTMPDTTERPSRASDVPYAVFLWNDPVTLMDVVVRVLSKVFGYDGPTAEALMLRAHRDGKAVVWSGDRDQATRYCIRLGRYGLQSTVARA